MNVFRQAATATGFLALGACASVTGGPAPIDPASPAAAQMQALLDKPAEQPKFVDIPPLPTDVRAPEAFADARSALEREGEALALATAPNTWSLEGTESFAARARADSSDGVAPSEQDRRATDAFADELRRRATPPPLKR
ncbi:MAG TPA: hypothetical protein VEA79_13100 [Phenylobacterium sp.]|nr:hypothetical protein [Phenylobacterium sp.]